MLFGRPEHACVANWYFQLFNEKFSVKQYKRRQADWEQAGVTLGTAEALCSRPAQQDEVADWKSMQHRISRLLTLALHSNDEGAPLVVLGRECRCGVWPRLAQSVSWGRHDARRMNSDCGECAGL